MFDSGTTILCDSGEITLSSLISNLALEHVIVRSFGIDGIPGVYEYRHSSVAPNDVQTGHGTAITVDAPKDVLDAGQLPGVTAAKPITLTCSRRTRVWLEPPRESWVAASEVQVGDLITIFHGFWGKSNGVGAVLSVVDLDVMTGQQIIVENAAHISLAVYASGMLVSIPY